MTVTTYKDYVRDKIKNSDGSITLTIPEGTKIITPLQREIINQKSEIKSFVTSRKQNKKFTFFNIEDDYNDISPETLCRLVYLSTYLRFGDNVLMATQIRAMKEDDIIKILGIARSTYYMFKNETFGKYILFNSEDGTYRISSKILKRNKLRRTESNRWQRIYHIEFRALYNSITSNQHKLIGKLLLLLPFLNIETNVLCYDRFETDMKILKPLTLKDASIQLYFDPERVHRLKKDFERLTYRCGKKVKRFCKLSDEKTITNKAIYYNPEIIYGGFDPHTSGITAFDVESFDNNRHFSDKTR